MLSYAHCREGNESVWQSDKHHTVEERVIAANIQFGPPDNKNADSEVALCNPSFSMSVLII